MSKKILLINGPPRSGKNTGATLCQNWINLRNSQRQAYMSPRSLIWGFSYHLKRFVHGIYLGDYGWSLPPDYFDNCKDEPQEILDGNSWRQMYIYHSEHGIKPIHGKEWFGKMFLTIIKNDEANVILVPDSGFYDEALPVVREFGAENIILAHIYREGCNFDNDSRSYIDLTEQGVKTFDLHNTGDKDYYGGQWRPIINKWLYA